MSTTRRWSPYIRASDSVLWRTEISLKVTIFLKFLTDDPLMIQIQASVGHGGGTSTSQMVCPFVKLKDKDSSEKPPSEIGHAFQRIF